MKKLALALVCLVSVAFFASCTPEVTNPEPSIAIVTGDNYVYDGQTIDLYQEYLIGFRTASNSQTMKELATFRLETKVYEGTDESRPTVYDTTYTISGTEFVFDDVVYFELATKDLVGKVEYTATVTDVTGKFNSATINLLINQPAIPLEVSDFEWTKIGHNVMDLTSYGLMWHENNWKSPYTHIYAAEGYKLYVRAGEDFATITNSIELANYYNAILEQGIPADEQYNRVDCNASANYNDMLVTINEETGKIQLIHVTRAVITTPSQGTKIVITGKCK